MEKVLLLHSFIRWVSDILLSEVEDFSLINSEPKVVVSDMDALF